jgi:Encapsulating protein for peroxidase
MPDHRPAVPGPVGPRRRTRRVDGPSHDLWVLEWVDVDRQPVGVLGLGGCSRDPALTTRGGEFSLHLGQDLAIGYLSHTDTEVRLYLQETLTFLMLTSEAAVGFTPAA